MSDGKKSYFKITGMSDEFRKWDDEVSDYSKLSSNESFDLLTRMWELRFLLSIAQQLSIISGHLGKIVEGSEILREQEKQVREKQKQDLGMIKDMIDPKFTGG